MTHPPSPFQTAIRELVREAACSDSAAYTAIRRGPRALTGRAFAAHVAAAADRIGLRLRGAS